MPWYNKFIPETIKKSVCSCLIKRYLSHFIENEITRDQLNLDLYNGRATAQRISLAVEALNELGEAQNWPIEFVYGYIDKIHINVPWTAIFSESTKVEIWGLKVTVQPKQRKDEATSMFESMWNSMTSSMHLAEEFAKEENAKKASNTPQVYEGIELFAQTIDTVVRRIKIKFIDTLIQIEHIPRKTEKGVGLNIHIDLMEYYDDYTKETATNEDTLDPSKEDSRKAYLVDSITTKNVILQGINLSTVEFSSPEKTASSSLIREGSNESTREEEALFEATESKEPCSEDVPQSDFMRHVILCGKCFNNQEVKIRLKQSADSEGPKVAIELNLGSLVLFLSPRQCHILMGLIDGFSSSDLEDKTSMLHKNQPQPRPMTERDYQIVEEQLAEMTSCRNFHAFNFLGGKGWSSGQLDESSSDGEYVPMPVPDSAMYDSTMSGISSSMDSSITSSMISSVTDNTSHTKRRGCNIDSDPTAEISHFQVRLATLAVIILHEDLLAHAPGNEKILVWQMHSLAEKFFENIDLHTFADLVVDGFEHVHKSMEKACTLNHLRLFASPLKVEGKETTTSSAFSITGHLTASKLELSECLYNGGFNRIPLVNFMLPDRIDNNMPSSVKPNVSLKFKHVQKTGKRIGIGRRRPKTEVSIQLDNCSVEFDLSIVDRISALINHPPICEIVKNESYSYTTKEPQIKQSVQDLKISCPLFCLKIRFPIPDFRPATDVSKVPWWERNVRTDYLTLDLHNASFHTIIQDSQDFSEYNVECELLDIFYYESEHHLGTHLGRSGMEDKAHSSLHNKLALTKLTIKIYPLNLEEEEPIPDPMTHSFYGAFENQVNPEGGPFSSKKVVHESDTPHVNVKKDDHEEQVIPGDKQELKDFFSSTTSSARILVEVTLPALSVQLESKNIYEVIYNRINNDLLLWQSQAPKPNPTKTMPYGKFGDLSLEEPYILANSGMPEDSDSDSSEEDDNINIFYSAYASKNKQPISVVAPGKRKSQSDFILSLAILKGSLVIHPPVRDSSGNIIPGQKGELLLNINDANLFIVSGYKGDDDLGYVCVQVNNAQLYHCDILSSVSTSQNPREVNALVGSHLFPTICQTGQQGLLNFKHRGDDREMFTVAVKIQANHETHHVKVVTVSLGLNRATLKHRQIQHPNSWISHIIDFFNVRDDQIAGYEPKDVLTEMHLHIWDCAIDYRPLYLPLRSAITIGSFTIASHLTAVANTSTLTMMFEDCGLFLSEQAPSKDGVASTVPMDLKRDYVNVVDVGLFEISIKTTDKQSGINPHMDLRTSIDQLCIRTCSDSGRALFQLLTYYINDGDLKIEAVAPTDSTHSSPQRVMEDELISLEQREVSLTQNQQDQISLLLEEAMEDDSIGGNSGSSTAHPQTGAKLFYFPDEREALEDLPRRAAIPQVATDLGDIDIYHFGSEDKDIDEEFYFLGDETMLPKDGVPEITWFSQDVKVLENHFTMPVGKKDILAPPKSFPPPTARYTLRDMSVVWQMFGGSDFKKQADSIKKEVRFADKPLGQTVSFKNDAENRVSFVSASDFKAADLDWIKKGGANRDHSVLMELQLNKVRFCHEIYPETAKQASRQVLSVFNVEIRDRLASSQMNKFLYQYSSHTLPKQSHSNMVVVKALHSRPDPKLKREECDLKISLLAIRLNIDQDSLLFLVNFFKELSGGSSDEPQPAVSTDSSVQSSLSHQPPIITTSIIDIEDEKKMQQKAKEVVAENLILLESRYQTEEPEELKVDNVTPVADDSPIFFRHVEFSKDVLIRLDYDGKRVDMSHGPIAGILMGLGHLKCSEIRLKRIVHRHGLLGFNKLIGFLFQEWITDIKKNQLSNILGGVGPMKAVLQLFQGFKDLFWLPIEQYQKDGRIVRGLQRGANSFATSTAMSALELTTKFFYLLQITAETVFDMLSPGPSIRMKRLMKRRGGKKRYHQPQDIREGLSNACLVVKEGIGETADNILQVASSEKEQKGISGAVGAVIRQIPATIIKPVVIASEATTNVLGGIQSQLVPDARKEANEKWRSDS